MRHSKGKRTIIHIISSLKYGGAESMLADMLIELPHFQHYVIYMHDGPIRNRLEAMHITCIQLKGLISFYDPLGWWRLYRHITHIQPDIIHTSLWAANLLGRCIGKLLKIKTICVIHAVAGHQGTFRTVVDALTFWCGDEVVAVSQGVKHSFDTCWLIPARPIHVIKNGINIEKVKTIEDTHVSQNLLGYANDDFIIGAVGRLVPVKNFELLIKSVASLSQEISGLKVLLIGQGPLESRLRKMVKDLDLEDRVRFIINENARKYYALFDCFIQPSWYEGLSMALLEAMCFSVPCIVSGRHCEHEVIEHRKQGLVIEPDDQEQLMAAIHEFYQKPEWRKDLAKGGFDKVSYEFSIQKMVQAYDKFFSI